MYLNPTNPTKMSNDKKVKNTLAAQSNDVKPQPYSPVVLCASLFRLLSVAM